jgi:hypothetical protein
MFNEFLLRRLAIPPPLPHSPSGLQLSENSGHERKSFLHMPVNFSLFTGTYFRLEEKLVKDVKVA